MEYLFFNSESSYSSKTPFTYLLNEMYLNKLLLSFIWYRNLDC